MTKRADEKALDAAIAEYNEVQNDWARCGGTTTEEEVKVAHAAVVAARKEFDRVEAALQQIKRDGGRTGGGVTTARLSALALKVARDRRFAFATIGRKPAMIGGTVTYVNQALTREEMRDRLRDFLATVDELSACVGRRVWNLEQENAAAKSAKEETL